MQLIHIQLSIFLKGQKAVTDHDVRPESETFVGIRSPNGMMQVVGAIHGQTFAHATTVLGQNGDKRTTVVDGCLLFARHALVGLVAFLDDCRPRSAVPIDLKQGSAGTIARYKEYLVVGNLHRRRCHYRRLPLVCAPQQLTLVACFGRDAAHTSDPYIYKGSLALQCHGDDRRVRHLEVNRVGRAP